jgi:hypothetical protein
MKLFFWSLHIIIRLNNFFLLLINNYLLVLFLFQIRHFSLFYPIISLNHSLNIITKTIQLILNPFTLKPLTKPIIIFLLSLILLTLDYLFKLIPYKNSIILNISLIITKGIHVLYKILNLTIVLYFP